MTPRPAWPCSGRRPPAWGRGRSWKTLVRKRQGRALLRRAVEEGDVPPNLQVGTGRLVHHAASHGSVPLLRCLCLGKGVDPNQRDAGRSTALHVALAKERGQPAALFLVQDVPACDVNARAPTSDNATPLMLAARHGWEGVVRALVAKRADVHAQDANNRTALIHAATNGKDTVGAYLVAEAGAKWRVPGGRLSEGVTAPWVALYNAADGGLLRLMRATLGRMREEGMGAAALADHMVEAASYAVRMRGEKPARRVLRALGAVVGGMPATDGMEALMAMFGGGGGGLFDDPDELGVLEAMGLSSTMDAALQMEDGSRVLMSDAAMASLGVLIEEGLEVMRMYKMSNGIRTSLLHTAAQAGDRGVVDLLLENGGDARMHDGFGEMPHHCAAQNGETAMVEFLLQRFEIPVDAEGVGRNVGATALHAAARKGRMATVGWLIDHGADPCKLGRWNLDEVYRRASNLADYFGYHDVASFLRTCEDRAEAAAATARVEAALAARRAAGVPLLATEAAVVERQPPSLGDWLGEGLPDHLTCPVSLELVEDPVVLRVDGCTYSRTAIERHFAARRCANLPLTSPTTNLAAANELTPNAALCAEAQAYKEAKTQAWVDVMVRWREWQQQAPEDGGGGQS